MRLPLKQGEKGQEILILQKFLNYLADSKPGILEDGNFGQSTEQAVKNFQHSKDLNSDGVVGEQTYEAMLSEGLNQQLIDKLLNYRYGKILDFTQGKEYEVIEDATIENKVIVHKLEVEPKQKFRIIITSLERNAIFELIRVADSKVYARKASNSQVILESGEYLINISGIRGNTTYTLKLESIMNC